LRATRSASSRRHFARPGRSLWQSSFRIPALLSPIFGALVLLGLASDCGHKGTEAEKAHGPAALLSDSARVVFAGRPLEIPPIPCASALLVEAESGKVLYEQNAHERRAPASIAKMTLELVVMREVEEGRLKLEDSIRVSAWASQIGGSQAYLAENEVFTLEKMMRAIVIHSANDACTAVAEHIAGTTDGFVRLMNQEVELLGLENTHYVNVHGLDDEPGEGNHTTAADIAQVARELVRHPHILDWSSTVEEWFRDPGDGTEGFKLQNTNKLVGQFSGLDGLKTGYTSKAGFCLCATARRNGVRLISVILGAHSNRDRFQETAALLSAGFNGYLPVRVCKKGDPIPGADAVPVRGGKAKTVSAVAPSDFTVVVSRPDDRRLEKRFVPAENLRAPVRAGQAVGTLQVLSGGDIIAETQVAAAGDVPAAGFLRRLFGRG